MKKDLQIKKAVYNYLPGERRLFGEDVEEAIIQYLEKHGIPRSEVESVPMWYDGEDGNQITTKCLTIRW